MSRFFTIFQTLWCRLELKMYERIDCAKMKTVQLSHANIDFFTGIKLNHKKYR